MTGEEFARMVRRERAYLTRYASSIVGRSDAEDVVQIALLRAWMFDAPILHERSFLTRVVRNAALNHVAGRREECPLEGWDDPARDVAEIVAQRVEAREALEAVASLEPRERGLLLMTRGSASNAERQAVWRARRKVRAACQREEEHP